jgi:hypothetical protein
MSELAGLGVMGALEVEPKLLTIFVTACDQGL